jgi:hypothetical protein
MEVHTGTGDKKYQKENLKKKNGHHKDPSSEKHPDPFFADLLRTGHRRLFACKKHHTQGKRPPLIST